MRVNAFSCPMRDERPPATMTALILMRGNRSAGAESRSLPCHLWRWHLLPPPTRLRRAWQPVAGVPVAEQHRGDVGHRAGHDVAAPRRGRDHRAAAFRRARACGHRRGRGARVRPRRRDARRRLHAQQGDDRDDHQSVTPGPLLAATVRLVCGAPRHFSIIAYHNNYVAIRHTR